MSKGVPRDARSRSKKPTPFPWRAPTTDHVTGRSPEAYEQDLALVRKAASGDTQAQRRLADRLLDRVRATAYYLASGQDWEDLVQESLVEIIASASSFRGTSRLETWADRIAVRTIRREQRRRWRRQVRHPVDPDGIAARGLRADQAAGWAAVQQHLARVLEKITPPRREAFVLFAVHRYTAVEIGDLTGAPLHTVRDRIKVARRQLRQHARRDPLLREWMEGQGNER